MDVLDGKVTHSFIYKKGIAGLFLFVPWVGRERLLFCCPSWRVVYALRGGRVAFLYGTFIEKTQIDLLFLSLVRAFETLS